MALAADLIGVRIDIDKAPVNLALGWAITQHAHRLGKRRVDQHGSIDQRNRLGIAAVAMLGHDPLDKRGSAMPWIALFLGQRVNLFKPQRREGAGKAGRRAGCEHQLDWRRQSLTRAGRGSGAESDREAMLALLDHRRAVQSQHFGVTFEICCRDEQVDRVTCGQQRRIGSACLHRRQGLTQQPRKTQSAKRRFEPARTDKPR